MDRSGYYGETRMLYTVSLIPAADEALADFRERNALSEVDALNWLLQFGNQCAKYVRAGKLIYRDSSGASYQIVPMLGPGRLLA